MSGPSVYLRAPPASLFHFPPYPAPKTLPAPFDEGSLRAPFAISPDIYNAVLSPAVPAIFACCYIIAVWLLNTYNRRQSGGKFNRPWWISTTQPFKAFVVLHNVFLALYSLATFIAMFRCISAVLDGAFDGGRSVWPAQVADALCKMHGPRGLGDAASYNTTINIWESKNALIHLDRMGNPDPTDVGRLWNEGLAFWGWWFYVSKFYEVVDTLIIVAKGKRSATLQTYHHAGAMMCMWAGIRYMSPPIWMFVFINSGIHAMMYTYFTLAALNIRVSQSIKRTLTTLQIAQFIFGASYAALHLFVAYDIPVQTPYQIVSTVQEAVSRVSSAAAGATSAVSEAIESPTVTASLGALLRKYLLRAAGEEGIAEQVPISKNSLGVPSIPSPIADKIQEFNERTYTETRWRSDWTKVDCIDTSGEAFAIYLNLFYLFPLTALFGRFFYKAYTQRGRPRTASQGARQAIDAGKEAERKTRKSFEDAGEKAEAELERRTSQAAESIKDSETQATLDAIKEDMKKLKDGTLDSAKKTGRRVSAQVEDYEQKAKNYIGSGVDKARENMEGSRSSSGTRETPSKKSSGRQTPRGGEKSTETPKASSKDSSKSGNDNSNAAKVPTNLGNEQNEPSVEGGKASTSAEESQAPTETASGGSDAQPAEQDSMQASTASLGAEQDASKDKEADLSSSGQGLLGDSSIVDLGIPHANAPEDLPAEKQGKGETVNQS